MKRNFKASFNGFTIDRNLGLQHDITGSIKLQPKELAVLLELVINRGLLVSKDELIKRVWRNLSVSDSSIARCISNIKSKLNSASPGAESLIQSIYGEGYIFVGNLSSNSSLLTVDSLHVIINQSPDLILYKDGFGHFLAINDSAIRILGLEGKDWQGKKDSELAELLSPLCREAFYSCISSDEEAWGSKSPSKCIANIQLPDGTSKKFDTTKSPVFHSDGSRNLLIICGRDVTDILDSTNKQMLADKVLANSNDAIVITDIQNNIVQINRAFTQMTGYTEQDVIGKNPKYFSSGKHDRFFYQAMWREIKLDGRWRGEIWDRRKNGETYPKWLNISTVHDANGNLVNYIGMFSDLSERKATEKQIEFLAYHDQITQLPNSLLLRERFEQAIASAERDNTLVAVLSVDLRNFMQVNDSMGMEAGNLLLQMASRRLNQAVRERDTVSRIGGNRFVVLLSDLATTDRISSICQKIIQAISKTFTIEKNEIISSTNVGISVFPKDGRDFDSLLMMADTSMYHAKNNGLNTFSFFSKNLNIDSGERIQLQSDIRRALRKSEFTLHYQPRFDLKSHTLTGMEALIRWPGENQEFIPPEKFIPIAEESGDIIQIGEWVINEACRQCHKWQMSGISTFRISVNLSAMQFKSGNIIETVKAALKSSKLAPGYLELELTKSILIQDVDYVSGVLSELKKIGVTLSIGEFGTGYTSLSTLKNFPVDILKIDKSFVQNMVNDKSDAAIVHSITELAHSLHRTVIAEGVENQDQIDLLRKNGCDEVQGFFWGKPMPVSELDTYLKPAKSRLSSR